MGVGKIRRALISVSDKTGIVEFAYGLKRFGINILSTGGTAKLLRDNGVNVRDVSDYTGFPEMFEGRIKTLHPLIHGGILHKRDNPEHVQLARKHGMLPFDMVVVNLYPFQQTVARTDCTIEDAIENIDIGGSAMLRSAAKNNRDVTVLVDPRDYAEVLTEMAESDGSVSEDTNFRLATAAFLHTGKYDLAINNYLETICLEK